MTLLTLANDFHHNMPKTLYACQLSGLAQQPNFQLHAM